MSIVRLTKRIEFSASHRYHNEAWDDAKNRTVFGACNNPSGHGHNYLLEVTVGGLVDKRSGMVVNLFDLKRVLLHVLEEFDHKHLNLDLPYFTRAIPTTENIARVLWKKLEPHAPETGSLHAIRLYEDEDLFADITAAAGLDAASITRRFEFTAVHQEKQSPSSDWSGHTYDLFVTVHGKIDEETGMATDIVGLDRIVREKVIRPFNGQDLRNVLGIQKVTGEQIVRDIWHRLIKSIPTGRLEQIRLVPTRDLAFEYTG